VKPRGRHATAPRCPPRTASGAIVTGTTYSANSHAYVLAYGPLLFGGVRFVQGLRAYLARPPR
jgi:hypothetical protein